MGSPIQITPEYLATAASNCDSTASNIQSELTTLKNFVMNLEGIYHGVAADQFQALMTDYDIYARMLHDALTEIASGLRGNQVNYVDSETSNLSNLVKVNGSIPGGPANANL